MSPVRSASGMKVPGAAARGPGAASGPAPRRRRAAGAQVDVRLVVEHDLAALDGVGKVLLKQRSWAISRWPDLVTARRGSSPWPWPSTWRCRRSASGPGGQLGCRSGQADAGADGDGHAPQRTVPAGSGGAGRRPRRRGRIARPVEARRTRRHRSAPPSHGRPRPGQRPATSTSSSSPVARPWTSLTCLKSSRSTISRAMGCSAASAARVEGGGQALKEQRPVGQAGQRVVVGRWASSVWTRQLAWPSDHGWPGSGRRRRCRRGSAARRRRAGTGRRRRWPARPPASGAGRRPAGRSARCCS